MQIWTSRPARRAAQRIASAIAAAGLALAALAGSALAQDDAAKVARLFEALELPGIISVMQREGYDYADQIAEDLIPGAPGADWDRTIAAIYDPARMEQSARDALSDRLAGADIDRMLAFYEADPGRRIPPLEVSAREAMLEPGIEEAAKEIARDAKADESARYRLVREFVEANDLVELNVVGALNANFAFYQGLQAGGAMPAGVTEDQLLSDVWAQEEEIRQNTTEWVHAFLLLAYQPLGPADLETFIAFSQTEAGQQMNSALFAAFDRLFVEISRDLGRATAEELTTQEL